MIFKTSCKLLQSIILLTFLSEFSFGQTTNIFDIKNLYDIRINEIPLPSPDIIGDKYLHKNWLKGTLKLADANALPNVKVKFDLYNDIIEIQTSNGSLYGSMDYLEKFEFIDQSGDSIFYTSMHQYDTTQSGIAEILYQKELSLLKQTKVLIQKPSYNPAINAGDKNYRFVFTTKYFLTKNNSMIESIQNKKSLASALSISFSQLKSYIKKNNLDFNRDSDLVKVISYFEPH